MNFFAIFSFTPSAGFTNTMDVVLVPGLAAFFGLMLYIGGVRSQATYDKPNKLWIAALVVMIFGAIKGLERTWWLKDLIYRQTIDSGKGLIAHYVSLGLPLVMIAAMLFHRMISQRAMANRVY
jgi:hypothetical protein